jgi:hypothetical protein
MLANGTFLYYKMLNFLWKFFFLVGLGLNSGLCACKAGAQLLEPHLLSVFSGNFRDEVSEKFAWAGLEP